MLRVCVAAFHSLIALSPRIGDVDVARGVHRHAIRVFSPRRPGWSAVGGHVAAAGLGHGQASAPAMVSVPVRVAPVLASKVNVARPLPLPLEVVCSQEALAVAVQAPAKLTMSESLPAAGPSTSDVLARAAAWVTVRVWPAMVSVPRPRRARVGVEGERCQAVAVAAGGRVQPGGVGGRRPGAGKARRRPNRCPRRRLSTRALVASIPLGHRDLLARAA